MPTTIKYSNNPNSDTAFVVQDGGQKNRAVLTAEPAGTLQLSDSANVSTGYVTDEDGKKHKVNLVAQLEGDIEFSENPNSTKGYVTVDSKKHRVVLTASLHGGGEPINNQDISVTTNGTYTADEGYTGLGTVSVNVPNPSTGTKNITANGVYDVTAFASADVQVPTTAPAHYIEKNVDANGKLISGTNIINLNGVTDVSNYGLSGAYYGASFPANTSIDMSSLTTLSGSNACSYMFQNSTGITSVDLSSLTTIVNGNACSYMFQYCTGITSVDLSSLTTINGSYACQGIFQGCSGLASIDLSSLTTINGYGACDSMFSGCAVLTTAKFNVLNTIMQQFGGSYSRPFDNCIKLESVEFGGLTASTFATKKDQLQYLFKDTTGRDAPNGCTLHFPSNFDPSDPNHTFDASTLTGYPTFGGSASYIHVAFDLPATES